MSSKVQIVAQMTPLVVQRVTSHPRRNTHLCIGIVIGIDASNWNWNWSTFFNGIGIVIDIRSIKRIEIGIVFQIINGIEIVFGQSN